MEPQLYMQVYIQLQSEMLGTQLVCNVVHNSNNLLQNTQLIMQYTVTYTRSFHFRPSIFQITGKH